MEKRSGVRRVIKSRKSLKKPIKKGLDSKPQKW